MASKFLSKSYGNKILCQNELILGNSNFPAETAPINIRGTNGRPITINGEEVNPTPEGELDFKDVFDFDGAGTSLVVNPNGGIVGNTVVARAGYQAPQVARVDRGGYYQVYFRGSIRALVGFVVDSPVLELPVGWRPSGRLYFVNGGNPTQPQYLGCEIDPNGDIINDLGGSYFALDGITFLIEKP